MQNRVMKKKGLSGRIILAAVALGALVLGSAEARAAVTVGGLSSLYAWSEDGKNLVQNPSFEEFDGTGKPKAWTIKPHDPFVPATGVARSGARSAHIKDSHLADSFPQMDQSLALAPGRYVLRGWVKAEEAGKNQPGSGGRLTLSWGKEWASTAVVRGTTDWTMVERPFGVAPGNQPVVRLEAYRKPDGSLFFDDIEIRRLKPPAVEGFLRYPNYRGVLFPEGPQKIEMSVTVRPEEAKLSLAELTVRLTLAKDGTEGALNSVEDNPSKSSFVMAMDTRTLPPGEYLLRLQAFHRGSGKPVFEYPAHRIVKLSPRERKELNVYVDHDNVLVLGDKRVFVLGIYDTSGYYMYPGGYAQRLSEIAQAPINLYLNYWLGGAPVPALEALMTALQQRGIWYLHTVNAWYEDNRGWKAAGGLSCGGAGAHALGPDRFTACMAGALSRYRGLAGWYTADEAPAEEAFRVFDQYRILRASAPGGVTFIAQMGNRGLQQWRDVTDVMGVDPYPIYNIPQGMLAPLEMVTDWVEQAQAAVERSRPVWAVIQFFQHGSRGHWPTEEELRTMSYMAIVGGAKGLFYWSYGAKALSWVKEREKREELWQRLVRVTKEIKSLEPALLSPDSPDILSGVRFHGLDFRSQEPKSNAQDLTPVRVLGKRLGDVRYLIAVNHVPRETPATFTLAEPAGSIEVIGEGRGVQLTDGSRFADLFAPYATHVYKIHRTAK